jgi:alpha-1,3-rhamnosyl/mannosyltransferase
MARRTLQSTIVHAPNYFLPVGADKSVTTVHDLSVFRFPETHPIARVRQFERLFEDSLNRATRIITDTETVRCELIEMFNVLPNRITAVALGVSDRFRPLSATELEPPLGKWGLTGSYGLCVSALEPRKKVLELIGAWRRLPIGLRNRLPLVLAGGGGWLNEEIKDQVAAAEAEGWLRNLGHVDEADLPRLYAGARLFIYPSTYEGFGLPPVEAMACGVPAVVADRSCLREVCGEAPKYVDPENDNEFLTTIMESLENEQWRAKAVQCGLNQAAKYTWARCIEDTVAVYRAADLD